MAILQGVRQIPPSDDWASAPAGFDWSSRSVVVGFGLNTSKLGMVEELQAARPKPQISSASQLLFMSAFLRAK